jgi:hypothetical protein
VRRAECMAHSEALDADDVDPALGEAPQRRGSESAQPYNYDVCQFTVQRPATISQLIRT